VKRKAIQLAGKSLVISLPSEWVKRYNIHKGDEIDVIPKDNALIVSGNSAIPEEKITVDISALDFMISRVIGAVYKSGYEEARIYFNGEKQLHEINKTLKATCTGFETIKTEKNYIIVRNVTTINKDEFDNILRRYFFSIISVANDIETAMKNNDKKALNEICQRDENINKLADLIRRFVNKYGYLEFKKTAVIYFIIEQLEKIADIYHEISNYFVSNKIERKMTDAICRINKLLSSFHDLFYHFNLEEVNEFGKTADDIKKDMAEENLPHHFYILIEQIFNLNSSLLIAKL